MQDVKQEDPDSLEEHPPSARFIHSAASYAKTLHGRLIAADSEFGAMCIDCHAPDNWKHEIRSYHDEKSASHPDNLGKTCGQANCHGYAKKPGNEGFTLTDMHDLSLVGLTDLDKPLADKNLWDSNWFRSAGPLIIAGVIFALGSLIWWLFYRTDKKILAILGGDRFEKVMIGRKGKKSKAKNGGAKASRARVKKVVKVTTSVESDTKQVKDVIAQTNEDIKSSMTNDIKIEDNLPKNKSTDVNKTNDTSVSGNNDE